MNTWQFNLSNWQWVGLMWAISISFAYTGLLVWAFPQSHKLNLTYCVKSSLLIAFLNILIWAINFIIKSIMRSFIMLNTVMENENMSFANILIPFMRSCSQHCQLCHCHVHSIVHGIEHDLRKGIKILARLVFSFSFIVFSMMKLHDESYSNVPSSILLLGLFQGICDIERLKGATLELWITRRNSDPSSYHEKFWFLI